MKKENAVRLLTGAVLIAAVFATSIAVIPAATTYAISNWGWDTIGPENQTMWKNVLYGNKWTAPDDMGTVTSVKLYTLREITDAHFKAVIIDAATNATVTNGISNPGTITADTPGWYEAEFTSAPNVTASNDYYLLVITDLSVKVYYEEGAGYIRYFDLYDSYASPVGDNITPGVNRNISVYAEYEEVIPGAPSLTTENVTDIGDYTANITGTITDIGSGNATYWGIQYGKYGTGYTDNSSDTGSQGTGSFTMQIAMLSSAMQYQCRAFARNDSGISYGNQQIFSTTGDPAGYPTCTTLYVSNITETSATISGNITDLGGDYGTGVIVNYSDYIMLEDDGSFTSSFKYSSENRTLEGSFSPGTFTVNMTELLPGTEYCAIVGVRNAAGIGWADNYVSFNTTDNITSACTITTVTDIGTTTANISGTLVATNFTQSFGIPVIDEDNLYGGWMLLGQSTNGTYAHQNLRNRHTAGANEVLVGYGFRTKSRYATTNAFCGLYEFDGSNVTSQYSTPVQVYVPEGNGNDPFWVYSETLAEPLVEGDTYCAAVGNFTDFWGNKTTGDYVLGDAVWVMEGHFPGNASEHFGHVAQNKYNVVAFYSTPAENVTEYGFFYGTESGVYTDNVTAACNMNAGTTDTQITGLTPNTTYYTVYGVKNGSGWDYSEETYFTTGDDPVSPVPEPFTILLLGAGAAVIAGYLRLRQIKQIRLSGIPFDSPS